MGSGVGGAIFVGLGLTLKDASFEWMSIWWMWFFPVVTGFLIGITIRVGSCSAGAEWFAARKDWVRTYELTSVKVKVPANYRQLELEDSSGRKVGLQLMTAQENPDLWDLVYNGILHSVVNGGAEANGLALRVLDLPDESATL